MFKRTYALTEDEKRKVSKMSGDILFWVLEGRSTVYMAERLGLKPYQVEANMDEILYTLMRRVGKRRFIKTLFMK